MLLPHIAAGDSSRVLRRQAAHTSGDGSPVGVFRRQAADIAAETAVPSRDPETGS